MACLLAVGLAGCKHADIWACSMCDVSPALRRAHQLCSAGCVDGDSARVMLLACLHAWWVWDSVVMLLHCQGCPLMVDYHNQQAAAALVAEALVAEGGRRRLVDAARPEGVS